jgi:hypothetical protein
MNSGNSLKRKLLPKCRGSSPFFGTSLVFFQNSSP